MPRAESRRRLIVSRCWWTLSGSFLPKSFDENSFSYTLVKGGFNGGIRLIFQVPRPSDIRIK